MVSSPLRTIASRFLARAQIKKFRTARFAPLLSLVLAFSLSVASAPAYAHQPVILDEFSKSATSSPVLLDGTVSFAVYATFTKLEIRDSTTRFLRFRHEDGDRLTLQYLIPDTRMMRKISRNSLPEVTLTSPGGKSEQIRITERTAFFERYSGKSYFYLARIDRSAQKGIYTIAIRPKRSDLAVSTVIAVGTKEIPGDVLSFGTGSGSCPAPIEESEAIENSVARQLVGMKEESAELCAKLNDWTYRVGERDGEFFALTRDYRIDRITVSITEGIITDVQVG